MADDQMHEFPDQPKPADEETGSSGAAGAPELNPEDYYRAYDARMELLFGSDRLKICGWLNIGCDSVTAEDLARACLSDDVQIQAVRLQTLFEMCGLVGEAHSVVRADLVKRLAEAGPQSVTEMQVLFQAIATEYMAARFASDAMRLGQSIEVMSLQLDNFSKAAKMGMQLREAQHKLREAARPGLRLLDAAPHKSISQTKSLPAGEAASNPQSGTGETRRG